MTNNIETDFRIRRAGGRRMRNRKWERDLESVQRQPGVNSAIAESRALLNDEELKLHVYKKTLQAYLYPISSTTPHKFVVWTAKSPAHCYECGGLLWGLARQGLRCIECGVKCHEKCQDLLNADCLQKAAAKSSKHGAADKTQNIISTMRERMEKRENEKKQTFEMIRQVFDIPPERHAKHMKVAKQSVLDGTCKWSAKLSITILEAQDLLAKDKTGASDPYVTVEVGKVKKRTKTIFNTLDPEWNETFQFECHDSSDRVKIRVWDEDDDLKSQVKQKLLRESDDFLGHALILVHTLSGEMDVWHNLEKRTDRSAVSGAIHIKMNVQIKGEESCAPYRRQYTCLHENIFHHLLKTNDNKLLLPDKRGVEESWCLYFPGIAQDVINEFSMRYGIEAMYQAMTHFSCLAGAYQSAGAKGVMADLIGNITRNFADHQDDKTSSNKFEASNFGKEKFLKLLENLRNSLRIDLSSYKLNFPSNETEKLVELKSCITLVDKIVEFQSKVLDKPGDSAAMIGESCRKCAERIYNLMFENCNEMYDEFGESTSETPEKDGSKDKEDSLGFWMKLITLITATAEESKVYGPIFQQYGSVDLPRIIGEVFWPLFAEDIKKVLKLHEKHPPCQSNEYMNLQFRIKGLHKEYIAKFKDSAVACEEYFSWFETFTLMWMLENENDSVSIVQAAFISDKKSGFMKNSEHVLFSSSIVDIFTQLNQSWTIMSKLECSDKNIQCQYEKRYCKTIDKVLREYAKLVQSIFPEVSKDAEVACVLINNIQQGRIQLEKLYQIIGGENLPAETSEILQDIQNHLNDVIDRLSSEFVLNYKDKISSACASLGHLLRAIKGGGGVTAPKASTTATRESNGVIKPLMDVLGSCLEVFAKASEKTILKRILKELWKLVITSLEGHVVLPGLQKASELREGDLEVGPNTLSIFKDTSGPDSSKSLTPKQCAVLETALHSIKDYFHASGNGLKRGYVDKSQELKKLMNALSLYTQTTDTLIKLFVQSQLSQVDDSDVMGEIDVQVDLFTHPGTGEHKVTVKVIAANLIWKSLSMFRPFIEVNMIGPFLADKKRRFSTKSRSGTLSPKYNESFTFELSNEAELDIYEVQFFAKDWCFAREDKVIGIGIMQLREIIKQGSCACWCPMVKNLLSDQTGQTILQILSQRQGDNIAREFVHVKSCVRSPDADA